jgi:hypothetical protein
MKLVSILARLLANVIRRLLRIVGAVTTRASVRESHLQCCLDPLPLDRRASRYYENEKLSPDALDRSNDQPLPATSNCVPGLKWRVVCTTIRFRDSLLLSCSYPLPSLVSLLALPSRPDPLEFIVCFKNEATADLTCCDPLGLFIGGPSLSLGKMAKVAALLLVATLTQFFKQIQSSIDLGDKALNFLALMRVGIFLQPL